MTADRQANDTGIVWQLVKLGSPIAFGRIAIIGMGIVDLIVVGQFAGDELPHLTLAYALAGPLTIGGIGLMLGVQVLGARAVGAGNPALAGKIWRKGLVVAIAAGFVVWITVLVTAESFYLLVGVDPVLARAGAELAWIVTFSILLHLMFVASTNFLEAIQNPVPGAVAMWLATGLNLALNLALVPLYGALGCAWTTVMARLFLAASLLGYILIAPITKRFIAQCVEKVSFRALLAIGSAATVSGLVEAGAFALMGLVAVRISPESMAAFSIATGGLLSFIGMLAAGLGAAAAVLISQAVGRGDWQETKRIGWTAIALNTAIMVLIGIVCALFADAVARGFTADEEIVVLFAGAMWLVAILFIPDLGQMVVDPALRARGENWFPTTVRLVVFVGVAPALAIWFVEFRQFDVSGVFWAIIIASSIAYAALLIRWSLLREI